MINYNNKVFRVEQNTENGETSSQTIFRYQQQGHILWASYAGGEIVRGHLMGIVDDLGHIQMSYHHINTKDEILTGRCFSTPEVLENGKIRLHEDWEWTGGKSGKGNSTIVEV